MVRTGRHLWAKHPAVDCNLTVGEKAADSLKHGFGTWTALFSVGGFIAFWTLMQVTGLHWDRYPYILLNLCLSCLAAVQGIILQISANRQDRINAEAAAHDREVLQVLLDLQRQQMTILAKLDELEG